MRIVIPILLLATFRPAAAQEPAPPVPDSLPPRWGLEAAMALNASGGNESLAVVTSTLGLTHLEKDRFELGINGSFRYGRSQGEEVARNSRAVITFDFRPRGGWTPFLFASGENDPFRKLDLRFNGGAGVKRTFWQEDWSEVSLSLAALYSQENLDVAAGTDPVTRTARWSWRGRARRQLSERSRVEQVVFWQPELTHGSDYLLESQSSVRIGLTRQIALNLGFRYERDSTPAPDVQPDDWALTTGINLTTRW